MTEKQLIMWLLLMLLLELLAMRNFWLRSEKAEEENKKLKAANAQLEEECLTLSKECVKLSVQNKSLREEIENAHADYEDLVEQMED